MFRSDFPCFLMLWDQYFWIWGMLILYFVWNIQLTILISLERAMMAGGKLRYNTFLFSQFCACTMLNEIPRTEQVYLVLHSCSQTWEKVQLNSLPNVWHFTDIFYKHLPQWIFFSKLKCCMIEFFQYYQTVRRIVNLKEFLYFIPPPGLIW